MKVSELIEAAGFTPGTKKDGEVKTNHFILGIQTETTQTKEVDYTVAGPHVEALGQSIESETEDASYMYEGKSTSRTSAQRKLETADSGEITGLSGKRLAGDAFQDWACDHKIKYGTGSDVIVNYVYFNALTGTGEKGQLTIDVTSDGDGDANTLAAFTVEASSVGIPEEYTYSAI